MAIIAVSKTAVPGSNPGGPAALKRVQFMDLFLMHWGDDEAPQLLQIFELGKLYSEKYKNFRITLLRLGPAVSLRPCNLASNSSSH